ncbi:MAG: L-aspartate oxidase [Actinobacteria bacterium]|nr:L-aspartate oxidase [Actinomycetota bacterium]
MIDHGQSAASFISLRGADLRYSSYDVLVVGGGIAGLTAASGAAHRWNVGLITKGTLDQTTTFLAQGGIAAAMSPHDSPELHLNDTLEAGAGLCDDEAVRVLVEEGPARLLELERLGTRFDKRDGKLILGKEGAHSMARVVHAGGDATGSVVASALAEVITVGGRVELHENEFVVDLLMDAGRCVGALSLGEQGELTVSLARSVVLACGGAGQVFAHTTNPLMATGDGHAMAYRAGAVMRDMEFMQFHPTAFYGAENPTLLVTEALRGEGAYLRDDSGERFMVGSHPREELAPRDVVVRHIRRILDRDKTGHVWLDARHLDAQFLQERFPTVYSGLKKRGYDLCEELIPVAPASHYFIGGVLTDTWGRTSVPGLYACGETASTGIHGANRLASNSLLEGLVFGERTVRELNRYLAVADPAVRKVKLDLADEPREGNDPTVVTEGRVTVGETMSDLCGVVRNRDDLEKARQTLDVLQASLAAPGLNVAELELFNLLTVAQHMVVAAARREESRGVHLRSDFPERDDVDWRRHSLIHRDPMTDEVVVGTGAPKG